MTQKARLGEDVRIRRSRGLLLQALFDVTVEKGFEAVTVRDLAARAQVNRSTFYRHYLDKHELLADYLQDLQTQAAAAARKAPSGPADARVPAGLLLLLEHIQARAAFFRVMLGPNGDPGFAHRLRQISARRYRDLFARVGAGGGRIPPAELRIAYISHATVGAIAWWLDQGRSLSAEQLARWLGQLSLTAAGLDNGAVMATGTMPEARP